LALLFLRTLTKLKALASDYSKGHFESAVKISSTSTLYPLFNDLQTMGAKIKALIASHKELTHAVSHELRTPLTRLRFSLELSEQSSDLNDVKRRLVVMEEDVGELEELISEMLSYAKFEQAQINLKFESIELCELIYSAISQVEKSESPVKIITSIPAEMHHVRVDVDKKYFIRCLQNLLQNAARFARSTIEISLEKSNQNSWQLSIDDDGPGIAIEDRIRVFEAFVQLSHPHKRSGAGFGLGLAIVKKILDQHHWTIQIADSKLDGTRFILIGKLGKIFIKK
jgi:signal transduction histidine kinase